MCDANRNSQQIFALQWNVFDGSKAILFLNYYSIINNDNKAARITVVRGKQSRKRKSVFIGC